ncbi:MAG: M48 family metalloprotease [Thermoplasmata archaeon]|uniref:Protease HtpX homolog n=1 Tax=Candidatus Sysuiplasma superficiale TaxID=2823368 RepID=A0A8J8CFA1_9ARCH|nr:M48 family metalloprotease [Candidatus Sysuiplasma superficiale]MBX8643196.1 M48 family metalloprotease [Candidatus Sysuiplasma superficiale]MCL4346719.1 M48 family metalloprotease [Candidatus Thermoplasmatota archaeon]MCL5437226.1 M48 family metalloprotease [Candidatus Thermoplasmatota archaeon]
MGPRIGTAVLFLILTGLFLIIGSFVGYLFYGSPILGALVFLFISAAINVFTYFFATKLVLSANRARFVSEAEAPRLYSAVRQVSQTYNLPMPKIAISSFTSPNAFATGRNPSNAVVCATSGLLNVLDDRELRGVIAHEMAHIKDRDILVMSIAATIAGAISWAANSLFFAAIFGGRRNQTGLIGLLVMMVTVPLAAALLQLAISRRRETEADIVGARTIGDPLSLASALQKLENINSAHPLPVSPSSSSLYIVGSGRMRSTMMNIMSTHPPIEQRIRRLQKLAYDMGYWSPAVKEMPSGRNLHRTRF